MEYWSGGVLGVCGTGFRRVLRILILVVALAALPGEAEAHLVQTGFGGFYDGVVHFFMTPADFLVVVGLALLAGMRGRAHSRVIVVLVPAAWLGGAVLGMLVTATSPASWTLALTFGLVGALVVADRDLPVGWLIVVATVVALFHGFVNGATMAQGVSDWLTVLGAVFSVFVIVSFLSAVVANLRRPWQRVAVRVAGSWMVAVMLLMIGWALRPA